ncbi:MAG: hypothetical protein JEZ12_18230 [Desulfobacterium sp.]|nr:hypothetical protein [Desulfobacterium sp.]
MTLDPNNNDNKLGLTPKRTQQTRQREQMFTFSEHPLISQGGSGHTAEQICPISGKSTSCFACNTRPIAGKTAIKYRLTEMLATELQNRQKNPDKGFNRGSTTIEGVI